MTDALVETPSGKGAGDENFPVGSFLLPRELRPHVAIFYAYARAIDDIADNSKLAAEDKVLRLEGFARAIRGDENGSAYQKAVQMRESLRLTGVTPQHCLDLIHAFKQDATKGRYRDWAELIDYCNHSAAPVGRYLLDLHGESTKAYPYSDALCNALQVINHLQDCGEDYRNLDRVYLPQDWLAEYGAEVSDLGGKASPPALTRVIHRCTDGVGDLMIAARKLPGDLISRSLAMESAVIVKIADRLNAMLRRDDPLAGRVVLNRLQFLLCGVSGVLSALFGTGN